MQTKFTHFPITNQSIEIINELTLIHTLNIGAYALLFISKLEDRYRGDPIEKKIIFLSDNLEAIMFSILIKII